MTIYKYPLEITGRSSLSLPVGYKILSVGLDPRKRPSVWAMVSPAETHRVDVPIFIFGTGHVVDGDAHTHLGTFLDGEFVWHVFTN